MRPLALALGVLCLACAVAALTHVQQPSVADETEELDQVGASTFLNRGHQEVKTVKQRVAELTRKVREFREEQKEFMEKVLHPAVVNVKVENGPRGLRGRRGNRGAPGAPGPTGRTGPQGRKGPKGRTGPQGPDGYTGPVGPPGPRGATGKRGGEGNPGEEGPRGKVGPRGAVGAPGPRGFEGPVGLRGLDGEPGEPGRAARLVRGPRGAAGREGEPGREGPRGEPGPPGLPGKLGAKGRRGPGGLSGPRGSRGGHGGVHFTFPEAKGEKIQAQRKVGCLVQMWDLPGDTSSLALAWVNPNRRYTLRAANINFQSPQAFALPNGAVQLFALRYTGMIFAPHSGTYYLYINSDDGSALYIDGRQVVNDDGLHGAQERGNAVYLEQGNHRFQIDYFQNYGGAYLTFTWSGPGINGRQLVNIYQPSASTMKRVREERMAKYGIMARFWVFNHDVYSLGGLFNGNPTSSTELPTPFLDLNANFHAGADNRFAAEYTGVITAPTTGDYSFWTMSDDGSQLFVDGNFVVNNDGLHGSQWAGGSIRLNQGTHSVKVLYFQNWGGATLRVDWQGPTFARAIMPWMITPGGVCDEACERLGRKMRDATRNVNWEAKAEWRRYRHTVLYPYWRKNRPLYCRHRVQRLYTKILRRDADQSELQQWTNKCVRGTKIETIREELYQSAEYKDKFNRTRYCRDRIYPLYYDVQHRVPDDSFDDWVDKCKKGMKIKKIRKIFEKSPEAKAWKRELKKIRAERHRAGNDKCDEQCKYFLKLSENEAYLKKMNIKAESMVIMAFRPSARKRAGLENLQEIKEIRDDSRANALADEDRRKAAEQLAAAQARAREIQHTAQRAGCFSSAATVISKSSPHQPLRMDQLTEGDSILTVTSSGSFEYSEVYFFGHKDSEALGSFVCMTAASNTTSSSSDEEVCLTPDHFVPVAKEGQMQWSAALYARAEDVREGMTMWVMDNKSGELVPRRVARVQQRWLSGLFNPFTLNNAMIVVDGVVASTQSAWFLDALTPAPLTFVLPHVYEAFLAPARALYHLMGAEWARHIGQKMPQLAIAGSETGLLSLVRPYTELLITEAVPIFSQLSSRIL